MCSFIDIRYLLCQKVMKFFAVGATVVLCVSLLVCYCVSCGSVRSDQLRNLESARVSVPKQFKW